MTGSAGGGEVPAEGGGLLDQLVSGVLERDVQAAPVPLCPLGEPAQPEDRLADAGGSRDQGGVVLSRPAAHQPDPDRGSRWESVRLASETVCRDERLDAREHLDAVRADPEGVPARPVASAAHLRYPQPPPVDRLARLILNLDDAVSQGELDAAAQLLRRVLADQQQHRAGVGDAAGQIVQRGPQARVRRQSRAASWRCRPPRWRAPPPAFSGRSPRPAAPARPRSRRPQEVAQVDVLDRGAQACRSKKVNWLQVPDELGMRLGHASCSTRPCARRWPLAKQICWARIVLPVPGAPARTTTAPGSRPPLSTRSSPAMPVDISFNGSRPSLRGALKAAARSRPSEAGTHGGGRS